MADDNLNKLIKDLAKDAVYGFIIDGKKPNVVPPDPFLNKKAGAFVSLKINKQLRGCLGTIEPQQINLAMEIAINAVNAATQDYRFNPITEQELGHVEYSIDVLSDFTIVMDIGELDVKKFGVIVKQGHRRGLLLPDLGGVETVEQQLEIAKHKAGIIIDKDYKIFKFEVKRF